MVAHNYDHKPTVVDSYHDHTGVVDADHLRSVDYGHLDDHFNGAVDGNMHRYVDRDLDRDMDRNVDRNVDADH